MYLIEALPTVIGTAAIAPALLMLWLVIAAEERPGPPAQVWTSFVLFGALFAVTSFLQTAYSKGDFPWLFGKIGGGLVNISFFTFLFLFLPKTVGSAGIQSTGLLSLIYLTVGLSYLYLVLDFVDARRTKAVTT